jgi:uncharacterized protein YndB with AHSA1/START domain
MIHGTQIDVDGRPALRFARPLRHAPERVWRAVSAPEELSQWFVGVVGWTPAAGERFDVMGQTVEVTVVEPPHRLEWTFADERYSFELRPQGDGTLLVFTHVFGGPRDRVAQHAAGWEAYFDRLARLLDGRPLGEEDAHGPVGDYHERYAQALGVDPEPGRRMIAGMGFRGIVLAAPGTARLRRRFAHPPERLWQAFTERDQLAQWFPERDQLEVVEQDPPHRLVARWWGQSLRVTFEPDGEDATIVVFEHDFGDPATSARTAAGWDRCFFALEALLAGHPVTRETSLQLWPDVHERYAEGFGVDPELGRAAYAQVTAAPADTP